MADQQNLFKELLYLLWKAADKISYRSKMRNGVTGECFEENICLAAPLNLSAGGNAFGIGEEDDF